MATLVLTAVGSVVGGPIGAAVGAVVGQAVDAKLLAPKARQGPRLGDLAVQTSSYGTPVPKLFGTVRVAGTVIWSTDLQERRSSSGGGKGKPKTVNYSYSASFAVALSARPVREVRRIWADGKLLRGAAGDFKTETKFRLRRGDEDQAADPLIASAEGSDGTPAYRGLAYAMFEDFQLADYGNRIPSLTFEVEADSGPVAIGTIGHSLSDGVITAGASPELVGYAAGGDSVRGSLETLAAFVPLSLAEHGGGLLLSVPAGEPVLLEPENGARTSGSSGRDERIRHAAADIPNSVTLAYHDPALDYQTGLQRAFRGGAALLNEQRALPVTLGASAAKQLAETRLAALWAGRAGATLNRSWRDAALRPGDLVEIAGRSGTWRIERWLLEKMVVRLQLIRVAGSGAAIVDASPGRPIGEPDLRHGPTTLRAVELPCLGERLPDRPQLFIAAAGMEPGWRRAALMASFDAGSSWQELGETAAPATMGSTEAALPASTGALFDTRTSCVVRLVSDTDPLQSATDQALIGGANLALIGSELVQFGAVQALGDRRYQLSLLLRGRFGTEWAMSGHGAGNQFLLLNRATLVPVDLPAGSIGSEVQIVAAGIEDGPDGVKVSRSVAGEGLRPPAPVHLQAERSGNGDLRFTWVRRSRAGWAWPDGGDVPIGEEAERYQVTIAGSGFGHRAAVTAPTFLYSRADQLSDGASGPASFSIEQIGTHALSRSAAITIDL